GLSGSTTPRFRPAWAIPPSSLLTRMRGWVRGRWRRTSSGRSSVGAGAAVYVAASCGSREGGSPEMTDKTAAELDAERVAIDRRLEEIRQLLGPVMREASEPVPELSDDERAELE